MPMGIAPRRDGKLWLVGLSNGEVWLVGSGGRSLRRESLPLRLRSDEGDQQAMGVQEKETRRDPRRRPPFGGDLTRPQPKSSVVYVTGKIRVIHKVYARDSDLVRPTMATQPPRAVILLPADCSPARCWTLPSREDPPPSQ